MRVLLAAAIALSWANAALAQSYPAKPVRYVVPFPAGGSPDMVARLLSERLNRVWGQPMVVENRSGAGGTVGAAVVAKATPDGYTLFQCNIASNAIAYSLYAKLPYEAREFAPVTLIGTTQSAIVVHPSLPAATVSQFISYAKANPGKLSYGSSGVGSSPQLAMELFKLNAKIEVVHIAYKGAAPAIADAIGGQVPITLSNLPALLGPVQAGRLRALAVTGPKRAPEWPGVPTIAESGMPGYEVTSWYGVCAPNGTPSQIIQKLNADFGSVLRSTDLQQRFTELVIDAAPMTPETFAAFIRAEMDRWAKVVHAAAIPQQ
jgi:tripartite-type tricarboxylate transporter receptor subunit TctC